MSILLSDKSLLVPANELINEIKASDSNKIVSAHT